MNRLALLVVFLCAPAFGQGWLRFQDQTATRIDTTQDPNSGPSVIVTNVDEKDYAWGDLDNDGDIDLVGVYKQPETTTGKRRNVLLMNQGGVLTDRTTDYISNETGTIGVAGTQGFLDLTNDRDVIVADVNNEGWKDIITSTTLSGTGSGGIGDKKISHPRIYINRGDDPPGSGNWLGFIYDDVDRVPTQAAEPRFCAVAAGDIDGDTDLDLYFVDYQQGPYSRPVDLNDRLWINNGVATGYFTDESTTRMTATMRNSSFGVATEIVDMNGDDRLDIVKDTGLTTPIHVAISYNNNNGTAPGGDGFFNAFEAVYTLSPYHIDVGDLNNDLKPDIIISDDGFDRYLLNNGNGADGLVNFAPSAILNGSASNNFGSNNFIADLNKDGLNDALVANFDVDDATCFQPSKIFRNFGIQGDGFSVNMTQDGNAGISQAHLDGVHDFAVFDLNGDTWLDVVIGNCDGTMVYINLPPVEGLLFSYPMGLPTLLPENQPVQIQVVVDAASGVQEPTPGTGILHLQTTPGGPFTPIAMTEGPTNTYTGELPAGTCPDGFAFFFSAEVNGEVFTDPELGAAAPFLATVAEGTAITFEEDVEDDVSAWTVLNDPGLTGGAWEQAEPFFSINAGDTASPDGDAEASGEAIKAFVTENCPAPNCNASSFDIDGGGTELISPLIDLDGTNAEISYVRWFYTSSTTVGQDTLKVYVANDGDQPSPTWVLVETVNSTNDGFDTQWLGTSFLVSDFVQPTANVRLRFRAEDAGSLSVVEAGLDALEVNAFVCQAVVPCPCLGDVSADGFTNGGDVRGFVDCFLGGEQNCGCANVDPAEGFDDADISAFVDTILAGSACP